MNQHPRRFFRIAILGGYLLAIACGASPVFAVPPCDDSPDPCFTNVGDILNGRRQLLPNDDLVVTGTFKVDSESSQDTDIWALPTMDSAVSGQTKFSPYSTVTGSPADAFNADSRVGRMFNLPNDVVVTVAPTGRVGNLQLLVKIKDTSSTVAIPDSIVAFSQDSVLHSITLGDITGDGFDDLFVSFAEGAFGGVTVAASALDVNDPSKGLVWHLATRDDCPYAAMALGNLSGSAEGQASFVGIITSNGSDRCALLSGVEPPLLCASLISQDSLGLVTDSTRCISHTDVQGATDVAVAAGNLDGAADGEEAVWFVGPSASGRAGTVLSVDFEAGTDALTPRVRDSLSLGTSAEGEVSNVAVAAGRLDWFGANEQAVIGFNEVPKEFPGLLGGVVAVLTFDNDLTITTHTSGGVAGLEGDSLKDLVVGNFDNSSNGERNFDLQAAVLWENGQLQTTNVILFDFDPVSFEPKQVSSYVVADFEHQFPGKRRLAAGDFQGRSMRLGPPTKVTILHHSQPSVVLGVPPMHIDYVRDVNNLPDGQPTELNLTALPTLFFAQYDTDVKGETQSSNTSTTSYAMSTKKTAGGMVSYGIPDIASVKASFKDAAERSHDRTVAAKHDTYKSVEFDVSKQTGFADVLWFTTNRFNVYYYPVLGETVCPLAAPGCSDAEKLPLHVQFSGPDIIQHARLGGSVVEWHQPLTEPGNVFSYPWNLEQLKAVSPPHFTPLSPIPPTLWATDGSGSTVSVNWSQGGTTKGTSGTTTTHSFDKSASVSADVDIDGFGASGDADIDYNTSRSINTENTSSDTLGSSNGVQIVRPGFRNPADFAYDAETYIFGQLPPAGVIQELPVALGISTGGTLSVASTADPVGANGGSWWKQAYTLPDVALNHPLRWNWIPPNDPNQPDRFTFNTADTTDPAVSDFYFMRGLFITPLEADGEGPQRTTATAGDKLKIEARVYNYSLVDMPPGTTLKVRFFVQEWDNTTGEFTGSSSVIGEQTLDPLPGFNSESSEAPNWTIADATFDTGDYSDKYVVFWVLVWMEDASGALVPEIEGHGLTMLPAEEIDSIAGVPVETYSNNVGFYKQPLFVKPAENAVEDVSIAQVDGALGEVLRVESVTVRPERSRIHEKTTINANLRTGDTAAGPVQVFFYDGDPEQGGELLDVELLPFLRSHDDYLVRVAYRPASCGLHTIFVEAVSRLPGTEARARGTAEVDVTCLSQTAILATSRISLGKDSEVVSGNVIDNAEDGKITIGKGSATAQGFGVIADGVDVKKDADVASDVTFNSLRNKGSITGQQTESLELPVFPQLPAFQSAPAGSEKIVVNKNQTRILAAGDYGKIIVKKGAKLVFSGGVYNVRSIKTRGRSALLFEAPSEVRVLRNFKAGKDTFVGPSDETTISAADIVFFVAGNKVKLARNSVAKVNFYTQDGKISFRGTQATGGFIGKKVTLGKGSKISVDSFVSE